jgi:iron complex outermembrane recepter protein
MMSTIVRISDISTAAASWPPLGAMRATTGARFDWQPSETDSWTVQGDLVHGRVTDNVVAHSLAPPFSASYRQTDEDTGGNILARWTRALSGTSQLTVQSFYNHSQFHLAADSIRADTFDLEAQHGFDLGERQSIVWGAGYRLIADAHPTANSARLARDSRTMTLVTGFAQDEIELLPGALHLALGVKLEHNYHTGFEIQPGARIAWTPGTDRTLWAAVSRAVRTPDRFETGGRSAVTTFPTGPASPPVEIDLVGNPNLDAEELLAYEIGYRFEPAPHVSLDVATFYDEYDPIIQFEHPAVAFDAAPMPHVVVAQNADNVPGGASYGAEASLRWSLTDRLELNAAYSWLHLKFLDGDREFAAAEQQAQLRVHLELPRQLELTGAVAYTDRLSAQDIDAYVRLDVGFIWRPTDALEAGVWGQNLLDERHAEFTDLLTQAKLEIPRNVLLKITKRF